MHTYETIFITVPTLSEDEERALVGSMAQVVLDGGGSFTVNERMGRRRLAYPIRKFDDGVYTRFLYDSEPSVPKELERRIRLSDHVMRSLTVRLEEDWAAASKIEAVREAERRALAEAEAERLAASGEAPPQEAEGADERRAGARRPDAERDLEADGDEDAEDTDERDG